MISNEDKQKVIDFAQEYRNRAKKVSEYKDELEELKEKISLELSGMQKSRENELQFLDEIRDKYNSTPDEVIQLIQKIVMSGS